MASVGCRMVVDTSAVLAVLFGEEDGEAHARALAGDGRILMSAFSVLECGIVVEARKGESGGRELELLLARAGIESVALTPDHVALALDAWRHYGRGRHPASLNIGDCCSYALARYAGEPLLYKGADFARTDIHAVDVRRF